VGGGGGSGPSCGNGVVEAGETCDKGAENGLELARCAPDCSRIIQIKHIKLSPEHQGGNLQPNPVAAADASCPVGYKALFAYAAVRRASTSPNNLANPIDWVIQPYTYYVNETENPVWLTDDVALLGMRKGAFSPLQNQINGAVAVVLTGLNGDWTTLGTDNCNGWSSSNAGYSKHYGLSFSQDIGFLYSGDELISCDAVVNFYCVEQ
jgi:hypothetical protein